MANYNPNTKNYGTSTNPVTGDITPGVVYNAPDLQNPYGSFANNMPNLNTNLLTQNGGMPVMPIPTPLTTPQQFASSLQAQGQPTPQQQTVANANNPNMTQSQRLQAAQNLLLGKGQAQGQLEQQNNLPVFNKQLADLQGQYQTQKALYDQAAVDIQGKPIGIERQTGKVAQIQRNEGAKLGVISAQILATQGNISAAKQEIDRAMKYQFEPAEQEIKNLIQFREFNNNDLSESAKIKLNASIDRQKADVAYFRDQKTMLLKNAIEKGLDTTQISSANTFTDLAKINNNTMLTGTPSEKVESLSGTISLIDSIKNSSGLNSRVGPTGLGRRIFAIGDAFGAGEAFAGSVQQLTSKQTLDTLINLKQQGGTLGALSDQERITLQNAASKISAWEVKDNSGVGKGKWDISEKEFKKELDKIKTITTNALIRAGGVPSPVSNEDYQQIQSIIQSPQTFNPSNYYQ